jgi:carbon-monoxide dehydrogenase small subunit
MSRPTPEIHVDVTVNGQRFERDIEARTLLVHLLRDHLELTGTNIGCDSTSCGACTVLLDGESVKSCTVLAAQADGAVVTTIEGLAIDDALHPMQAAFREHHGLQCGYCTPGMVMAAVGLAQERGALTEGEARKGLEGNLCRCTGYQNIVAAVVAGSTDMAEAAG